MNFKEVEAKWQKVWQDRSELFMAYDSDSEYEKAKGRKPKGKKYVLVEFPYPSGTGLHIGHAFSFTAGDIYARYLRLSGYNVLFPMGWDAFGLPTENFAIKTKRKPQDITIENTAYFRQQMSQLALSFDWSRELFTTDSQYYHWTQWIFIKLWEKGLAEKQKMPINWCPSCKIGLANEEVIDGKCERSGDMVEKREMEQWVVKITAYADRLAEGLKDTDFIEKVKASQINWIGKKWGAKIRFKLTSESVDQLTGSKMSQLADESTSKLDIEVFTTRPDTIYGVSAVVVAPEHPIILNQILQSSVSSQAAESCGLKIDSAIIESVKDYVEKVKNKSDLERTDLNKDKSGVFTGMYVVNPVNGKQVPVWVADYVLNSFGTGAIMLVPAHDARDYEFARKYGLEIKRVVDKLTSESVDQDECFEGEGVAVNSELINGQKTVEAKKTIVKWLVKNKIGEEHVNYHLRDWIFSRQHYWGEPVPMYRQVDKLTSESVDQENKWLPVPESELPVALPEVEQYEPTDDGKSPLAKIESFVKYKEGERDTDTMPNWAGSDWYYVGYLMKEVQKKVDKLTSESVDPKENVFLKNAEKLKYWLPVDVYLGGDEHNTLHLLYSRFIYQFLYDLGMVPTPEPYFKRVSHGVILAPDGRRMSKSKGNTIDPIPLCEEFGVDVIRTSMMFMGPFDATMPWNPNTVAGVKRFLERLERWVLGSTSVDKLTTGSEQQTYQSILNKTIKSISDDLAMCKFNTPVAKLMTLLNEVEDKKMTSSDIDKVLIMLAIYAPYLAEELWHEMGHTDSVHEQIYPAYDESLIVSDIVMIPVCINGKKRGEVEIANKDKAAEVVAKWIEGKKVIKTIYIPNKMVNLVVG